MTKIYEALEEAQKGRKGLEKPEIPSSHAPIIPSSHPPIPSLDMEEEMISLHHSIESILPDPKRRIIQFIGSSEGEELPRSLGNLPGFQPLNLVNSSFLWTQIAISLTSTFSLT